MTTELDCSIGISPAEASYGTNTTVTKFVEFTDESLDWSPTFVQGQGLRVGSRVPRSARRSLGKQMVAGDITMEMQSKGMGAFLMAALGSVTSTLVPASVTAYQHVFTPTTTDYLPSYTIQKGIPPLGGGAASPVTLPGMVCTSMDLSCSNSEIAMLKTSWNGKGPVVTATAYAAPSYPTPFELFTFVEGAITIGGSVTMPTATVLASGGTVAADIVDFDMTWDNGLDDAGFNIGSGGMRARKPAIGLSALTGKITAEYDSNVLRDAYLNQSDLNMVLTFTGLTAIGTGVVPVLQIVVPELRLEGDLPNANQGKVIQQSVDFTGLDNLTNTPLYIVYRSADTAP